MPRPGVLRGLVVDVAPVRLDPEYRRLWASSLVGTLGRQMVLVALPFELWQLTHSSLSIGLLAIVQLVPILTFALGGGAVADAVDRRRLLTVTTILLASTSVVLVVLAAQPSPPVWAFYVVAFVAAAVGAIDGPARSSTTPRLVPRERLTAAIAMSSLSMNGMSVAGPALAGAMIQLWGVPSAFGLDVVMGLLGLVAVRSLAPIPPHPDAARPGISAVREGLGFMRSSRIIMSSFVIDLDAMIFGMPSSLFPQLALTVFNVGGAGYGLLTAAPAFGAVLGAAMTGWAGRVRRPGRGVVVAVAAWGAAIVAFGLSTWSLPVALAFLALAGAADVVSAVLRSMIIQFETPDRLRGRLMSIHTLVVTSGPRLGDAEAAAVAALAGPQFSVVSGGILCLAGLLAVVRYFPQLLSYELAPVAARRPDITSSPADTTVG